MTWWNPLSSSSADRDGRSKASSSPSNPKPSSDGAFEAPDRDQRARCWDSRDLFYDCLDKNAIIESVSKSGAQNAKEKCPKELERFEENCASWWVSK